MLVHARVVHQAIAIGVITLVVIAIQLSVSKSEIGVGSSNVYYLQNECFHCDSKSNFSENYLNKNDFQGTYQHPKIPENSIQRQLYVVKSSGDNPFYVLAKETTFPRVDGDESQQKVIDLINLKEKCKEDPNTTVVDIGGYYGDFGLNAASFGCKVYIFEPTPIQYWMIRASIELNGFSDRVKLYNYAISSDRTVAFFRARDGRTDQIPYELVDRNDANVFKTETITLDEILPEGEIFLLKVDVEGFEPTVLFGGCKKILQQKRVRHIISEYTAWWDKDGKGPWTDFLNTMSAYGSDKTRFYALHREKPEIYSLQKEKFGEFFYHHMRTTLQTDVYVDLYGQTPVTGIEQWSSIIYA
jgi:FkbM family methyltransferase